MLIVGGGDGGVARESAKHPAVEKVVQCEIDTDVSFVSADVDFSFLFFSLHIWDTGGQLVLPFKWHLLKIHIYIKVLDSYFILKNFYVYDHDSYLFRQEFDAKLYESCLIVDIHYYELYDS